jgi:hypothetical protein
VIFLAILATVLSRNASTISAIQTAVSSFNRVLAVVVSPITMPN